MIDDSSLLLVTRGGLFTMAERRVDIISELKKKSFGQRSEEERWNIINEDRAITHAPRCGHARISLIPLAPFAPFAFVFVSALVYTRQAFQVSVYLFRFSRFSPHDGE